MAHLAKFLDNYDILLFDMDGVVTSEQSYWTSAAVTVWELLYSKEYCGNKILLAKEVEENAAKIRKEVFCDDKIIKVLKCKGVNSNWDLAYVVFAATQILNTLDFSKVLNFCMNLGDNILDEYTQIGEKLSEILSTDGHRNGIVWNKLVNTFQEWYLGDKLFRQEYKKEPILSDKTGYIYSEKPVVDVKILREVYSELSKTGKRLGVATGRLSTEIYSPLENFGLLKYFSEDGIITYTDIINAEKTLNVCLTKPHPYIFLKSMIGGNFSDEKIISGDFDKSLIKKTLVIGDAGADILSAKAMGADFCAVLTGVSGEDGRGYFEEMNAEYILKSLADFLED